MDFKAKKIETLINKLKEWLEVSIMPLEGFTFIAEDYTPHFDPPAPNAGWKEFQPGTRITGKDCHFWFHKSFHTSAVQPGQQILFRMLTSREGNWDSINPQCIILLNGKLVQALDVNHNDLLLEANTEYDMYLNYYTGMLDGSMEFMPYLVTLDTRIEKLYYDLSVPYNSAVCMDENSKDYTDIIGALDAAVRLLDLREVYSESYYSSIDQALDELNTNFYHGMCKDKDIKVHCIGHTHIDVAWLWTLAQTREKAQRTFSTVLNLMQQYPEYQFMSSQPQLYEYVKESAPELYERIKKAVKDGRWEPEGAMWLEADCNLTSGESLVRQILFGKRFMEQEFGVDSKVLWLPDVFGYSAALPQILKKAGVEAFVTSKISWNESNRMPYDAFMWEGIDGTNIFTYFITAQDIQQSNAPLTTYVGYIRPSQVLGTWARFQPKTHNSDVMITYGFGDGGGGPTKDMLEQQRRLAKGIPGMPQTKISSATEFLGIVEKNFSNACQRTGFTPKWTGELYLEFHRGTYTSMAKNKRNNRKSELLYQRAETLSCIGSQLLNKAYPQDVLNQNWKTILLNQFHDIIPGSSIFEVYVDSDQMYAKVLKDGTQIQDDMLSSLAQQVSTQGGILVYNPHSYTCSDVVESDGKYLLAKNVPAFGWTVIPSDTEQDNTIAIDDHRIENPFYIIKFDVNGDICSIYDKECERQVLQHGQLGNQLCVYEDYPYQYDAWELSSYYKDKKWFVDELCTMEPIREGARAGFKLVKRYGHSTFTQKILLYGHSRRIDFETTVNWQEDHVVLKALFPLDIHSNEATYEIQFGHVKRPTHGNTSWDAAKFEVCGQKWADLSEDDYGVSLLNDCKYGHHVQDGVMGLTLLKAASYPNRHADREIHHFTYALYPHKGNATQGGTIPEAQNLNNPLLAVPVKQQVGPLPDRYSFLSCEEPDVLVETVKKAEDSDDFIVRLYETANRRGRASLTFGFDVSKVVLCNLMEQELEEVPLDGNQVSIPVGPFEIVTLKIK